MKSSTFPIAVLETSLPGLRLWRRGKVRDIYDLGDRLLMIATDRISAFDVVLPTPIPGKGIVLSQLSLFWFGLLEQLVPNHVASGDAEDYGPELTPFREQLMGRSMIVTKADPLPVECVVRGYLAGSGWREYQATGSLCGIPLPPGLQESQRLASPLFTPSTKAERGHDENISFQEVEELLGSPRAQRVRELSLALYERASAYAAERGLILADTKFEFGLRGDQLVWIDEALTPDSSRFWPKDRFEPGRAQPSFDKQYVRDYLEGVRWDKKPPAPVLPPEVAQRTQEKYREAYARLIGRSLVLPDMGEPVGTTLAPGSGREQ
jgi:phosphoribosylaminoimidazole-succinocarboxamide synthase